MFRLACSPIRRYPRFIPRSTDSGTPPTRVTKNAIMSSAVASRTGPCSAGAALVTSGAPQMSKAPTAAISGRNSSQTPSAAPTRRRCAWTSSSSWRLATISRIASVGRPSAADM